jgi:hypothetical protein
MQAEVKKRTETEKLESQIAKLISLAADSLDSGDAMRFSQASLNAVNALRELSLLASR